MATATSHRPSTSESPARCFEEVDVSAENWEPSAAFVTAAGRKEARALLIGVAGDVTVDGADFGTNVTLTLPAGFCPISVTKIYMTGTDAEGIVALA